MFVSWSHYFRTELIKTLPTHYDLIPVQLWFVYHIFINKSFQKTKKQKTNKQNKQKTNKKNLIVNGIKCQWNKPTLIYRSYMRRKLLDFIWKLTKYFINLSKELN